ncbi:hypothetical protein MLD38_038301 [Melastoma candidum]|uniref:Uncharacterized protein n=1 Tax=Melastoma candidum TaxID=119954 RepID=A0ACB9KZP0_9MYRT|nr:hypothetical protein MLD38_038301 [Melastoma candidum]
MHPIVGMSCSLSFSVKSESAPTLDPDSFRRWAVAFCVVRFDLEQGQLVESCYPPGCLSPKEELEIAYSSFPDSVSQHQTRRAYMTASSSSGSGDRHDERLKRGGDQRSVVILSHGPYSSVFRPLLQIMGPLYFDIGIKALEHIAAYVSQWPPPLPCNLMELPIGNAVLKVKLPPAHSLPSGGATLLDNSVSSMAPFLPTNQSIPQGLTYIILSPEFAQLNCLREGETFPPMVLVVTNLFFLKALRFIPHIVSVGSPSPNANRCTLVSRSATDRVLARPEGFGLQQLSLRRTQGSYLEHLCSVTKPDTSILNRLVDAGMSPRVEESMSVVNNVILRRHFLELTTNFLAPFGPYLKATTPSEGTSPFVDPPPQHMNPQRAALLDSPS